MKSWMKWAKLKGHQMIDIFKHVIIVAIVAGSVTIAMFIPILHWAGLL
jgi:hypothetical protein